MTQFVLQNFAICRLVRVLRNNKTEHQKLFSQNDASHRVNYILIYLKEISVVTKKMYFEKSDFFVFLFSLFFCNSIIAFLLKYDVITNMSCNHVSALLWHTVHYVAVSLSLTLSLSLSHTHRHTAYDSPWVSRLEVQLQRWTERGELWGWRSEGKWEGCCTYLQADVG